MLRRLRYLQVGYKLRSGGNIFLSVYYKQYSLQVRMEFFELKISCHCMSIKMLCYMTLESMLYTLVMCFESSSKIRGKRNRIESSQVSLGQFWFVVIVIQVELNRIDNLSFDSRL